MRRLPQPRRALFRNADIASGLSFVKKTGLELLKASYSSGNEAAQKIPAALADFYQQRFPEAAAKRAAEIRAAGQSLAGIYRRTSSPISR